MREASINLGKRANCTWVWDGTYMKRCEIDTMDLIGKSSFTIPYFYYNHIDVAESVKQIMATY